MTQILKYGYYEAGTKYNLTHCPTVMKKPLSNVVKLLLITALALFPLRYPTVANADALSSLEDTLEDSRPSNDSNHTIQFVTPTGVESNTDTITLTFDAAAQLFNLTGVNDTDIDLGVDNDGVCDGPFTDKTLAAAAGASVWGVNVNTTSDVITFTAPTNAGAGEITAGRCVQIEIGTNAVGGGANDRINNPGSANYYNLDIAGTFEGGDISSTILVIIATITAEVTVDETLTFTVTGLNGTSCDFGGAAGDITTTSTSIPFASPSANTFIDGCQDLDISTNATDGYLVTVRESDQLQSPATDTIADGTCDSTCSETSNGTWATASNNGLGYCLHDQTGAPSGWAANEQCNDTTPEFKIFPSLGDSEAPETIMSETGSVSGDSVYIGYRLTVSGTQVAGVYSNNIIFVATPTY